MHDHPELELICFFCGEDAGRNHLMVGAFWEHEHGVRQEHWPAHAGCLVERMSEHTRSMGGPFLEAMAGPDDRDGGHDHG